MRGILTGGAQDQAYRSVPVVSNTTVLTPNTTATVTLTCAHGEWTPICSVHFTKGGIMLHLNLFYELTITVVI